MDAFKRLIDPIPLSDFVRSNWCKSPLLIVKEGDLTNLVSLDEINEYLSNARISVPFVRVVRDGKSLESREFVDTNSGDYNIIDKKIMFNLMAGGATIVIQVSHLTFPKLQTFSEQLERDLGVRMHANIYITPANAKGFHPHIDAHEVFVLQLSGRKNWNIYDKPYSAFPKNFHLPEDKQKEYLAAKPAHEILLQEGDVLYIPRGVVHDAYTANTHSIHITFGFHPLERIDVLKALVESASTDPFFCEYVFPTFDEFSYSDVLNEMKDRISKGLNKANLVLERERRINLSKFQHTPDFFLDLLVVENIAEINDILRLNFILELKGGLELTQDEEGLVNCIRENTINESSNIEISKFKLAAKSLIIKGCLRLD